MINEFEGPLNGACVLLEKHLNTSLLYLACRHHVFELVLRSVFKVFWPATSGPTTPIFKRFQDDWKKMDTTSFKTGLEDAIIAKTMNNGKDEILNFIFDQLEVSFAKFSAYLCTTKI